MSAVATSTLLVVVIAILLLTACWRTVLKIVAISVIVLTSVGAVEVVSAVAGGISPN